MIVSEREPVRAVVFDLFGTLVAAPSHRDRADAATELADAFGVAPDAVRAALGLSWRERHLGQWATVSAIAAGLAEKSGARNPNLVAAEQRIRHRARQRLRWDRAILAMLDRLAKDDVAVAVLSDASADIADAWPRCAPPLPALFSCREHAVKPDPVLYERVLDRLGMPATAVLYCGDGGGDELAGAQRAGMTAVGVPVRGGPTAVAHHRAAWDGLRVDGAEHIPRLLSMLTTTR
ncbi:HAD family hydrolase [Amycolatopsis nalaikhensis]|uniref:HAD hydrolase-like protein n=1 Tax=Amycolatopsis nalaikhensis TaxID=715472 RepID=A0ABY8XYB4_9PSEU|nr:HAD family hydrolase [Amycolatopsis sp. 2-2]WIV60709.1 HAD hydrolase-like protein [Amycolatopsis sp. 2-2]